MSKAAIGRNFGVYWIKDKLGSGGMASVFHAVHKQSLQAVALKVLHEQYNDDPSVRKRFDHEAKIAAQLQHPNIVPIWDYGEYKGRVFLTMPLMQGGNLANVLADGLALSHKTSLEILAQLANALDYAHSKNVIHRDFKLENILLNENSIPAISDFGIAQSPESARITMTGQILGTPQYLAPESFDNIYPVDYRLDLYAFAVTAYLMFTGYFPFTGPNALSIVEKQRNVLVPQASKINSQLPKMLDNILAKALSKEPTRRFASACEFVYALDAAFLNQSESVCQIFLDKENPLSSTNASVDRDNVTLVSAGTKLIDLHDISNAKTLENRVVVPAYEKPHQRKYYGLVISVLFSSMVIALVSAGFLAERFLDKSEQQNVHEDANSQQVTETVRAYNNLLFTAEPGGSASINPVSGTPEAGTEWRATQAIPQVAPSHEPVINSSS